MTTVFITERGIALKCMGNTADDSKNCDEFFNEFLTCTVRRRFLSEAVMISTSNATVLLIVCARTREKRAVSVFHGLQRLCNTTVGYQKLNKLFS